MAGRVLVLVVVLGLMVPSGPAFGITRTWSGNVSQSWLVAGNWVGNIVPVDSEDVLIPAGRPRYPTSCSDCRDLTVEAGASLIQAFAAWFDVRRITNAGQMSIGGGVYAEDSVFNSGTMALQVYFGAWALDNSGQFTLAGDLETNVRNSGVFSFTGSECDFNLYNCAAATAILNVTDGGWLDDCRNYGTVLNQGRIDVGTLRNYSLFENQSGGVLYLEDFFNYRGATLVNDAGAQLDGDDGTTYGTFTNDGQLGYVEGPFGQLQVFGFFHNRAPAQFYEISLETDTAGIARVLNDTGGSITAEGIEGDGRVVNCESLLVSWIDLDHDSSALTNYGYVGPTVEYAELDLEVVWLVNQGRIDCGSHGYLYSWEFVNGGMAEIGDEFYVGTMESQTGSTVRLYGDGDGDMFEVEERASFWNIIIDKSQPDLEVLANLYHTTIRGTLDIRRGGLDLEGEPAFGAPDTGAMISVSGGLFLDEAEMAQAPGSLPYSFTINAGGTLGGYRANVSGADSFGVRFLAGSSIDTEQPLRRCGFSRATGGGALLTFENEQTITLDSVSFTANAGCNIRKRNSTGRITVAGGSGPSWGPLHEDDPNSLVDWIGRPTASWAEAASLPGALPVGVGGWLAIDNPAGLVYAARGLKSGDFFSYHINGDSWSRLTAMQPYERKLPGKGACAAYISGAVYAVNGNNTLGFARYSEGAWQQLHPVPVGGGKKVKGGTDMVAVDVPDVGPCLYLLKGYNSEFYRFNVTADSWERLGDAPPSPTKPKYDKGSFLVYDRQQAIYTYKSTSGQLFAYDVVTGRWDSTPRPGVPLVSSSGRSKKTGDGTCGAWMDGALFALKAANTQEFWSRNTGTGAWAELETVPQCGRGSTKKKKPKAGADMVCNGSTLYMLKGNKTSQLWTFLPAGGLVDGARPARDGVAAAGMTDVAPSMTVGPNPVATGCATLRYSLPESGPATLCIYDVTGRTVLTRTLGLASTGSLLLDLRHLSTGVYLAKLTANGFCASKKLVIEK